MHPLLLIAGAQWAQLFFALSGLILLHEFGHYFFAKLFKTRVEKFYLFFDFLFPLSGVLNFSLFKFRKGDTQYGIGWFPLGGYVKIAGMVDESMDKEALAKPPEPWEYRSKPAWQRLFIMLGGIIVNVLTAIIVYIGITAYWGEDFMPPERLKWGVAADSTAERIIGLHSGDIPVGLDGKPAYDFHRIIVGLLLDQPKTLEVTRNGAPVSLAIPQNGIISGILKGQRNFISARVPTVVAEVGKGSQAEKMGLKKNDSIITINGQPVFFFDEFARSLNSLKKQPVHLTVMRNKAFVSLDGVTDSVGKLGFAPYDAPRFFPVRHVDYSFGGAIARGFALTGETVSDYWKQLKLMFRPEVKLKDNLGGIGTFTKLFSPKFVWQDFWDKVAFISLILAVMNLLPIPGLDGGYVIFLLYEMISGRKVNEKVMEWATTAGLILLLVLMLYANGLDIFRAWFKK